MGLSSRGTRGVLVLLTAGACRFQGGESDAHSGQAGGGEEEAEEMRIADILREEEDEQCCSDGSSRRRRRGGRRKCGSPFSRSPRCLLSRWLPSKQFLCRTCGEECKDEGVVEEEEEAVVVVVREAEKCRDVSSVTSLASAVGVGSSSSADKEEEGVSNPETMASSGEGERALAASEERNIAGTEWKPEQTCLSIGMGAGMLFLLTRSMTEFNKMIELRTEVEVMLKEIKEEMQRKDASPSSGESKNNLTFCGSNSWADTEHSNDPSLQDCKPCLELVETSCYAELDNHERHNKTYEDAKSSRTDEIEAELVSELELLQLNLDKQDSSDQPTAEFSDETTDPSERFSLSLGGHHNPKEWEEEQEEEDDTKDHYGVCPHELTRRLHELLETRQQERIAELESALELAHIKLREKEMEVSLWRDAAQLVSQNEEETLLR